ncbi:MAG TPA: chemotaxis protein CheB [Vicinamibacterales bacterium]|jgi:two-component system chemotaxis response regulator CheB|nr:chemotaxis protein CheB [Vicinamibacterales bacterium]
MARHDIILIGASAGGVEAISRVIAEFPRDLHASVFVVLHISRGRSLLPEILSRAGRMPAAHPTDGEPLQYGRIYIAPPDHHMIIDEGRVRAVRTASENGLRPALDPLFRSAARCYGQRVIAVVLTGALDDGTAGAAAVKLGGGVTIAQDPAESFAPGMPTSAINAGFIDHVLPLRDIPVLVTALVDEEAVGDADPDAPVLHAKEPDLEEPPNPIHPDDRPGRPSVFTCPACHGTLWEAHENGLARFRCRVGHVYSPESMLAAQTDEVDRALWIALRTLEERAALSHRLAERGRERGQPWVDAAFTARAAESEREAMLIRELLHSRTIAEHTVPDDLPADGPALGSGRKVNS